ncbi:MAG: helix-hairpin-helix domain-containing protein [Alphaproteobacteria bacterium]
MAAKTRKHRPGMTLLLTLMVLMILSIIIVQFQSDAALHLRASSNRLERQQCRYAAESGIVIGAVMVREALREAREKQHEAVPGMEGLIEDLPEPCEVIPEPNEFADDGVIGQPSYVFKQTDMELEEVDLEIEVHDENAKWPIIWVLRTPFAGARGKTQVERSLRIFGEALQTESPDVQSVADLSHKIGDPLQLPESEVQVEIAGKAPKDEKKTDRRTGRRRQSRSRSRRLGYRRRLANARKRRALMPVFAEGWTNEVLHNPKYADLREPLPSAPGSFADHLGLWGTARININAASAELLASAFGPVGVTEEIARAMVDYREVQPFISPSQLTEIAGIDDKLRRAMQPLCVTEGRFFTIHVRARRGRTESRLVGGVYVSKGRVISTGVISGG